MEEYLTRGWEGRDSILTPNKHTIFPLVLSLGQDEQCIELVSV